MLQGLKPPFYWAFDVAAEQVAEKCSLRPSGVKTPEEKAAFMSCLKARPTKLKSFSASCGAATHKAYLLDVYYYLM